MMAMNRIKPEIQQTLFFGVLLVFSFFLLGWADDLGDIKKKAESVNTIEAAFTQERHLEMLDEPLYSKGLLFFETPSSLRWEYTSPVRSVLLMEDRNIRQYAQAGADMVEQKGRHLKEIRIFLQDIAMWMQGEFDANPDLNAELQAGRKILLKPAKDNIIAQMIQRIELRLTDSPGVIESVRIYEDPNAYTTIRFHDTKINQNIEKEIFQRLNLED